MNGRQIFRAGRGELNGERAWEPYHHESEVRLRPFSPPSPHLEHFKFHLWCALLICGRFHKNIEVQPGPLL